MMGEIIVNKIIKNAGIACLVIFLSTFSLSADKKEDVVAFKKAYSEYQKAAKCDNKGLILASAKTAFETGLKAFGENHKNTANLALIYTQRANAVNASKEAQKAIEITERIYSKIYGEDAVEMIDVYFEKAKANTSNVKPLRTSIYNYNKALKLAKLHYGSDSLGEGILRVEMAEILSNQGYLKQAKIQLQSALKVLKKHGEEASFPVARANFSMGKYYVAKGNYDNAADFLNASLNFYQQVSPSASVTLTNHALLVSTYEELGMSEMATKHCVAIGEAKPLKPFQEYKPVYYKALKYPHLAQRAGIEGYTILEFTVSEDGFVENPKIIERQGAKSFEKTSLEAVKNFRYAPRFENGKPVKTYGVKYRMAFALEKTLPTGYE